MASNQRENARKEKQLNKERKIRIVIWIILIVTVFGLAAMRVAEVDFSGLKDKITHGKMFFSTDADAYPYTLDTSSGAKLEFVNGKIVVLTDLSCKVLNPSDAKEIYTFASGYANPVMTSAGKYLFTVDQGGSRIRLDNTSENVYESTLDSTVICGDVSKNGNVIYAVRNSSNKTEIVVMNESLKKLATFGVSDGYVVAVAIDVSGKKCAYATVNSKNAKTVTTLHTINVGDESDRAKFEYPESDVLDLQYADSRDLYYIGNESVHLIKSQKDDKEVYAHGSVNTVAYNYTDDKELVYVYSKYADASENYVNYINSGGKIKTTVELKQKPKFVSADNEMCLLFSDKVVTYSITSGELKNTFKCDDSVTSAHKLSSKIFVTRHQLVDVLEE